MKKWFLLVLAAYAILHPHISYAYKVTTISPPVYYGPRYYNNYYGGYNRYGYPPPPVIVPNIPYNNNTYYNYYNRMYPMPTPLVKKSGLGVTNMVMPYASSTTYTPATTRNYGKTTVTQYYPPNSTRTNGKVIRYYY